MTHTSVLILKDSNNVYKWNKIYGSIPDKNNIVLHSLKYIHIYSYDHCVNKIK